MNHVRYYEAGIVISAVGICLLSCDDPFQRGLGVELPEGISIEHYENRSGFMDSHHIMILDYERANTPGTLIDELELKEYVPSQGNRPGVISSEWPPWWQPEFIYNLEAVYERKNDDRFVWYWVDHEYSKIYLQWGTR